MTAVLNIPNAQLGHPVFCTLFKDSKLGTINAVIASKTVDKEYYRVRDLITKELNRMKRQEAIFTLTIDEWSFRRKRFIGVFLCSSQTIKFMDTKFLELLYRFREQATAPNLLEGIRAALQDYELTFDDISGVTTDAASAMVSLARLIESERAPTTFFHQKCFVHALHLAVANTLSEKCRITTSNVTNSPSVNLASNRSETSADFSESEQEILEPVDVEQEIEISDTDHWLPIKKIRAICQEFIKSDSKSDQLEAICREIPNFKPLTFPIDIRIRWNSCVLMLKRFIYLLRPLRTFFERQNRAFPLSHVEISSVERIVEALKVVEEASERLSSENATLFDADLSLEVGSIYIRQYLEAVSMLLSYCMHVRLPCSNGIHICCSTCSRDWTRTLPIRASWLNWLKIWKPMLRSVGLLPLAWQCSHELKRAHQLSTGVSTPRADLLLLGRASKVSSRSSSAIPKEFGAVNPPVQASRQWIPRRPFELSRIISVERV